MYKVIAVEGVEALVQPGYASLDIMHDLAHIRCLQKLAKEIARSYEHDPHLLEFGAYFYGNIS